MGIFKRITRWADDVLRLLMGIHEAVHLLREDWKDGVDKAARLKREARQAEERVRRALQAAARGRDASVAGEGESDESMPGVSPEGAPTLEAPLLTPEAQLEAFRRARRIERLKAEAELADGS